MKQNIRAIIFDLDGTLLDTLTDLANSLNGALRMHELPVHTTDEVRQFVGNGIAKLVERALDGGKSHPLFADVLRDTKALYAQKQREHTAPYSGIPELLSDLHAAGYRIGVVSNKPDEYVKVLCRTFFGEWIGCAVGQREGMPLKPAAAPLLCAMQELDCTESESVYVGDSDVDIETARNAGIPCISVLWGFRDRQQLEQAGGKLFAQNPAEIKHWF